MLNFELDLGAVKRGRMTTRCRLKVNWLLVFSVDVFQGLRYFADSGVRFDSIDDRRHQVLVCFGVVLDVRQGFFHFGYIALQLTPTLGMSPFWIANSRW